MAKQERHRTDYPGVFYVRGPVAPNGKVTRVFHIRYRKGGRLIEEKIGTNVTPARAAKFREMRLRGEEPTNAERRQRFNAEKAAEAARWTIDRLWGEYKTHRNDSKTLRVDDNRYVNHLKELLGYKEPPELDALTIERIRVALQKSLKPQTVKHVMALLKRIINFGVERGLCAPPAFAIKLPHVDNRKTENLTPAQIRRLLEVLDADSNKQAAALAKMALHTGMRRGELFRLAWDDVNLHNGFILIREPKGKKNETIPLNKAVREILEGHPRTDSPFVFPGKSGGQRTDVNRGWMNKIRQKAELPKDFRLFHGLRHVFASVLASSGQVDLYRLQKLLTHKDQRMTQRYAHLHDQALKDASEVAADIFGNLAPSMDHNEAIDADSA